MSVMWTGLEEFKAQLRQLPEELTEEATEIVTEAAEGAEEAIKTAYGTHYHTGNLVRHVRLERQAASKYGVHYALRSTARHAYLFEVGTKGKIRYTKKHVGRGAMPAANIFVPLSIRFRNRKMYPALAEMLERQGFTVTGREP
jgi:hypothetical protein